mmetsp:Transcript_47894/g.94489  ORF Transcript_47894/g.94489 Transcript_47894/m.94489 type:complete len:245 (-) Transcript_47894:46-780(-)
MNNPLFSKGRGEERDAPAGGLRNFFLCWSAQPTERKPTVEEMHGTSNRPVLLRTLGTNTKPREGTQQEGIFCKTVTLNAINPLVIIRLFKPSPSNLVFKACMQHTLARTHAFVAFPTQEEGKRYRLKQESLTYRRHKKGDDFRRGKHGVSIRKQKKKQTDWKKDKQARREVSKGERKKVRKKGRKERKKRKKERKNERKWNEQTNARKQGRKGDMNQKHKKKDDRDTPRPNKEKMPVRRFACLV